MPQAESRSLNCPGPPTFADGGGTNLNLCY